MSSTETIIGITAEDKIETSSLKTDDSKSVKKANSVTTVEKQDDYEKETVIEFGKDLFTPEIILDSVIKSGKPFTTGSVTAADYFPTNQPISRITIREKGSKKEKTTEQKNTYDSTSKSSKEQIWLVVTTKREVTYRYKAKIKNVVTSGPSFWQKIKTGFFIFLIVAIVAVGEYFKIWGKLWLWWLVIWNRFKKKK